MKQKVMVVNGSNFGQILAVMDAIFSIVPQRALKTWIIDSCLGKRINKLLMKYS